MSRETLHTVMRDGNALAALHRPGKQPTLVFLPGLRSDMTGDKATALAAFGAEMGLATLRLDYSGHGQSDGAFEDGSIARWRDDAIAVIDALAPGRVLLVGSSMGGWIGLLVAKALAERVSGFVGIAAAPDFTRQMEAGLSDEQRAALAAGRTIYLPAIPDPLPITARALSEGESCCIMEAPIALDRPVRLLHGQQDDVVPWRTALEITEKLTGNDCRTVLVKDGDHRLSRPQDIALLRETVAGLLQTLEG
ncbi:alpha/beta hydrolase [Acetobacteraceae bacterium KSS8]|uniref:Palmitoyl-protein thioesterase ABHD10, mitochondrial n=1 Tax=Endosaccharibacter trunci TaxID=2812733 RepID=A0ABT1W7V2_9PROT|nr:alpha/beta hydrolase [Acetobacteraceae bacterium KSS8]